MNQNASTKLKEVSKVSTIDKKLFKLCLPEVLL